MRLIAGRILAASTVLFFALLSACPVSPAQTQSSSGPAAQSTSDPADALNAALAAACRENGANFAKYLTVANADSFLKLSPDERTAMMSRFVLLDVPGQPLLSTSAEGQQVLLCAASDANAQFTFGAARVHDNLAYIPISVTGGGSIQFGLVREDGSWKLLSIGLLLIDIPQLQKQWGVQDLLNREQSAMQTLQNLAQAIDTYQRAFGDLPQSLVQLGPSKDGVSPSAAKLIDAGLASGSKNGYTFRYRIVSAPDAASPVYEIAAMPAEYGKSGKRSFLLDQNGKIHAADKHGGVATVDDPTVTPANSGNSPGAGAL
ncbi:MAG TPA: hypothetical protein VGR81_08640 [Candidatus Acidoferrales bacterium]|nr:hypothetical protein [Candidatus Acidoferrales bacterium]